MSNRHKIAPCATGRRPKRTGNKHWDRRQPIPEPKAYGGKGYPPSAFGGFLRPLYSRPFRARVLW